METGALRQADQEAAGPPKTCQPRPVLSQRKIDSFRLVRQESETLECRRRANGGVPWTCGGSLHGLLESGLANVRERLQGLDDEGMGLQVEKTHVRSARTRRRSVCFGLESRRLQSGLRKQG